MTQVNLRNTGNGSAETTERVAAAMHETVDRVAGRAAPVEQDLRDRAARVGEQAREREARARDALSVKIHNARQYVRKQPLTGVGVAAGLALAVGALIGGLLLRR